EYLEGAKSLADLMNTQYWLVHHISPSKTLSCKRVSSQPAAEPPVLRSVLPPPTLREPAFNEPLDDGEEAGENQIPNRDGQEQLDHQEVARINVIGRQQQLV